MGQALEIPKVVIVHDNEPGHNDPGVVLKLCGVASPVEVVSFTDTGTGNPYNSGILGAIDNAQTLLMQESLVEDGPIRTISPSALELLLSVGFMDKGAGFVRCFRFDDEGGGIGSDETF